MIRFATKSPEQTETAGYCLGSACNPGDLVCLEGILGSGKTSFAKGMVRALGFDGYVTSPTFTVMNLYEGRLPIYHFDVYRLGNSDELYNTGYDDCFGTGGVIIIEWADLVRDALPDERITVSIGFGPTQYSVERDVRIDFNGPVYGDCSDKVRKLLEEHGLMTY